MVVNSTIVGTGFPCPPDQLTQLATNYLNAQSETTQRAKLESQLHKEVRQIAINYVCSSKQSINQLFQSIVADEIVEKVFLNLSRFKFNSSIKTWIISIANRTCKDFYRSRLFRQSDVTKSLVLDSEENDPNIISEAIHQIKFPQQLASHQTPEGLLLSEEANKRVNNSLETLSDEDRLIIELLFFHDYRAKEVAEEIGLEKSNFSHRKRRILNELKNQIN